jgi:DNA-binding transcriptional LysR family regulator
MPEPLESAELLAFVSTVDAKSLSAAAKMLRVPRVTLSRRLSRLEERLGTRLLRRTTRSLALTDAGTALYRHARIVLDALSHAEESVRNTDHAIRGDLRVSVPPISSSSFYRLVLRFAAKYPAVRLQLNFSSRIVDLARGEYDVALRASSSFQPGLVARPVARDRVIAVASPRYLGEHGTPRSARELREHRCLMGFARGEVPESQWPLADGGTISLSGAFFSNEPMILFGAAVQHQGIALLPGILVRAFLANGRLVHVLPGIVEASSMVAVVYAEREFVPPQVRAFADALVAWAPENLGLVGPPEEDCEAEDGKAAPPPRERRQGARRSERLRRS